MNATKAMARKHGTKAAFLSSLLSLFLCVTMLIGTTLAWFTDTVTSGDNQIIAGNLDIDVEYWTGEEASVTTDDVNWASIQDVTNLFDTELWEPGATEVVYLRVRNEGTLALNWYVEVDPISETGGINAAGNSFKLSDYLMFGTTTTTDQPTTYTRDQARAAATVQSLNSTTQDGFKHNGQILKEGESKYFALVVYMPTTVNNDANYKTGTTPPQITLGVNAYATQAEYESDSFGTNYDGTDDGVAFNANDLTTSYNYFPQINVTGQLKISGTVVLKGDTAGDETSVTKIDDTKSKVVLASTALVENEKAAKLTTTVQQKDSATTGSLTLKVEKDDSANATFQADSNKINTDTQDSTTYQVSVDCEGVTAVEETAGKALYQVDLFIGKNRTNVKMYHNGTAMTEATTCLAETFSYNASTGYVTMYVNSFSPFTAVYDNPVAAIGTTTYYTLSDAVAAVSPNVQTTITMLSNVTLDGNKGITIANEQNIVLDLNGQTVTNAVNENDHSWTINNYGTLTVKDSTDTQKNGTGTGCLTNAVKEGTQAGDWFSTPQYNYITDVIENNGVLTVESGLIKNTAAGAICYAVDNNSADGYSPVLNLTGGKLEQTTGSSATVRLAPATGLPAKLNMTGGTIKGTYGIVLNNNNMATPEYEMTITGGIVEATSNALYTSGAGGNASDVSKANLSISGGTWGTGTVLADGALINVSTFTGFITGGTFTDDPSAYVAKEYRANKDGNVWTVSAADYWTTYAAETFTTIDTDSKTLEIANAAELALFAKNVSTYKDYAVKLTADIDLADHEWVPISSFNGTFDGNNKTISNMTVQETGASGLFASTDTNATIKDLTISKAKVTTSGSNAGVLAGSISGSAVTNVKIYDCVVNQTGGQYAGGLTGQGYPNASNCTVTNCKITGVDQVGGLIGYQWVGSIKGCTVTNNTVTATSERAGGLIGKLQVASGNLGSSSMNIENNIISGTATAPDMAGGIAGQIMGDDARYTIKNNNIDVTLSATATNPIGVLRSDNTKNDFTDNLSANIRGNYWTTRTSNSNTCTIDNDNIDAVTITNETQAN